MSKQYKRIRYRLLQDGSLTTPTFEGQHDVVRGYIKGNFVQVFSIDGTQLFFQLCASEKEAKEVLKSVLIEFGVSFLDEVRNQ